MDLKERSPSNNGSCCETSNFVTSSTASVQSNKKDNNFSNGIKVHFIYDELSFPKKIQASTFKEFYTKVFSALSNKKSTSKPCNLQYQFGSIWYNFNENTEFDDLGMDEENLEIFIRATSSPVNSALSGILHI